MLTEFRELSCSLYKTRMNENPNKGKARNHKVTCHEALINQKYLKRPNFGIVLFHYKNRAKPNYKLKIFLGKVIFDSQIR